MTELRKLVKDSHHNHVQSVKLNKPESNIDIHRLNDMHTRAHTHKQTHFQIQPAGPCLSVILCRTRRERVGFVTRNRALKCMAVSCQQLPGFRRLLNERHMR